MNNKYLEFAQTTVIPMVVGLGLGIGFGLAVNQRQTDINKALQREYDELKTNYNALEETYKGEQQELYDYINLLEKVTQKNPYDVDGNGEVTATDYIVIKDYIMDQYIDFEELKKYCPDVDAKLREFMGGELEYTEEGKKWLNNFCKDVTND